MRIAPRTMLCGTDFQTQRSRKAGERFADLRQLCGAAGDKASLAIGMTGWLTRYITPVMREVLSWFPNCSAARLDRRSHLDRGVGNRMGSTSGAMLVNSGRSCAGRRPSSTWPTAIPPRAAALASVHRWQSHCNGAAMLGGGWDALDGGKTSATPSQWPETATRQPSPLSSPGVTTSRWTTGCFGAMTPQCALLEEAVQTAGIPPPMSYQARPVTHWVLRF